MATTLAGLRSGGKAALARALAAIETEAGEMTTLLDAAYAEPRAQVIGLTGPPGVGKSTLTAALIRRWRSEGRSVGVIAVDPSSRASGGALLGDRTRMATDPDDAGVFVRSMAARERLGGLAELSFPAMVLMRSVFDIVLVETVGVGQSETDVAGVADTVVFCIQPGSGDSLQFMKAGIMEVPDVLAVTKADTGPAAERAKADVEGALTLTARGDGWLPPVLAVSAAHGAGLGGLAHAFAAHWAWLSQAGRLARCRGGQAAAWLKEDLQRRVGTEGLAALAGALKDATLATPFAAARSLRERIDLKRRG